MIPAMMTGTTHLISKSGRRTPIALIPTPDLEVPYDAPRPDTISYTQKRFMMHLHVNTIAAVHPYRKVLICLSFLLQQTHHGTKKGCIDGTQLCINLRRHRTLHNALSARHLQHTLSEYIRDFPRIQDLLVGKVKQETVKCNRERLE